MKNRSRSYLTKIFATTIILTAALSTATAHAASPHSIFGDWFSAVFNWHPIGNVSNMLETRRDNVETGAAERNQMLISRKLFGSTNSTSWSGTGFASMTGSLEIPKTVFDQEKTIITDKLIKAINVLASTSDRLSTFISTSEQNGNDMSVAQDALDKANTDVATLTQALSTFSSDEPTISSDGTVDASNAQNELNNLVYSYNVANADIESALRAAGSNSTVP
ncbi:MAG: hypothetical protein KGJ35_00405 [Patescibacteria group bacterium]|nr:hypothetical protein [Patescibacteria group bacterium]